MGLGQKRTCQSCAAKFYDLDKDPIKCPKCGSQFDPEVALKPKRGRKKAAVEEEAKSEDIEIDLEDDSIEVDDDDEAAEGEEEDIRDDMEIEDDADEVLKDEDEVLIDLDDDGGDDIIDDGDVKPEKE